MFLLLVEEVTMPFLALPHCTPTAADVLPIWRNFRTTVIAAYQELR